MPFGVSYLILAATGKVLCLPVFVVMKTVHGYFLETVRTSGLLWNRAIKFYRWQHPAVGAGQGLLCMLLLILCVHVYSGTTAKRSDVPRRYIKVCMSCVFMYGNTAPSQ